MSKKLYEGAIFQLRGRALGAYAALELLFQNPTAIPDHSTWVDEIIKHTAVLAQNENAMITLQQYFGKQFVAPPAPPIETSAPTPPRPAGEPRPISPEMSSRLRQSPGRQRMTETKRAPTRTAPQKELYPKTDEDSGLKEVTKKSKKKKNEK